MANQDNKANVGPSKTGTTPLVTTKDETGATDTNITGLNSSPAPTITTTPNIPTDAKKPKKVEVDADALQGILDEIKGLKKTISEIESTSSQDQTRKIEALRASGKLVKAVKVRRFDGDLVLGWATIEDKVWMEGQKLHEVQTLRVFTEGGEKETTLLNFTRGSMYEQYEVVGETKTHTGDVELKIQLKDGRELIINSKYVN